MKQCSICGVVGSYTSNCTPECRKEYRRTLDQFKEKQRKLQETGHKICTTCKQIRRYDGFSKDKGRKEGISNRCKICDVKRFRKFYKEEKSRPKLEYVVPKSKICTRCKESKSIDQFLKRRERGNFQAYCIPCQAAYRREKYSKEQKQDSYLKRTYDLSLEQYRKMLTDQDERCGICGDPKPVDNNDKLMDVDHCHATGKVRGILCHLCNLTLGTAKDNPDVLRKAAFYLESYRNLHLMIGRTTYFGEK